MDTTGNPHASAKAHAENGQTLERAGKPEEARAEYEASLRLDPALAVAAQSLAALAEAQALKLANDGNLDGALTLLERTRVLVPDDEELARDLGTLALNCRRLDVAERELVAAHRMAPEDARAIYALARLRLAQQHMPESEALFRAYLAKRPDDATAHYGLGHLLAMLLRRDEARVEFERSIALASGQTDSYVEMADLDALQGDCEKAIDAYRAVLARAPEHVGALTGLGTCLYRKHAYAEAEPALADAVRLAPGYGTARYYHGLTLGRLGRDVESKSELGRAAELAPQQSQPPPR